MLLHTIVVEKSTIPETAAAVKTILEQTQTVNEPKKTFSHLEL